jgi:hypothetical protein
VIGGSEEDDGFRHLACSYEPAERKSLRRFLDVRRDDPLLSDGAVDGATALTVSPRLEHLRRECAGKASTTAFAPAS